MIFGVIKNRWLLQQRDKFLNQDRVFDLSGHLKVVILYNADEVKARDFLPLWSSILPMADVEVLGFSNDPAIYRTAQEYVVGRHSIRWIGGYKDIKLRQMIGGNYNLQLNFIDAYDEVSAHIATVLRSGLKVGLPSKIPNLNDIEVGRTINEKKLFINEVVKCLDVLNK